MGRYGASELMRNKKLQKKAINYGINKLTPFIQESVGSAIDELSTKVRPNKTRRGQTTPQIFHQGMTKKALIRITLKVLNTSSQKLASEQRRFGKSF